MEHPVDTTGHFYEVNRKGSVSKTELAQLSFLMVSKRNETGACLLCHVSWDILNWEIE